MHARRWRRSRPRASRRGRRATRRTRRRGPSGRASRARVRRGGAPSGETRRRSRRAFVGDQRHVEVFERLRATGEQRLDVVAALVGDELALVHHEHAVAQALGNAEEVGRHQDRGAGVSERAQRRASRTRGMGIEAVERLVEQRDLDGTDERGSLDRWVLADEVGPLLAGLVAWRATDSVASASHAWVAGTVAAFMVAFMRVPFHIYWRPDAALLAPLPIEGCILFASAVRRCIAGAAPTLVTVVVGAIPFAALSEKAVAAATHTLDAKPNASEPEPRETPLELFGRHAGDGVACALVAATFIPAVAMYAASLVAGSRNLLQIA